MKGVGQDEEGRKGRGGTEGKEHILKNFELEIPSCLNTARNNGLIMDRTAQVPKEDKNLSFLRPLA